MPDTATESLSSSELGQFKEFGDRAGRVGVNFAVCDEEGRVVLLCEQSGFSTDKSVVSNAARRLLKWFRDSDDRRAAKCGVKSFSEGRFVGTILEQGCGGKQMPGSIWAAIIDLGDETNSRDHRSVMLGEMLSLFAEKHEAQRRSAEQMDMISNELAKTYEELVLLYKISTNMGIVEPDANFLQMACDSLTDIVEVEGIAVLQEKMIDEEKRFVLVAGSGLIDINEEMTVTFYNRLLEAMSNGREALLDSEVDSPFKYEWASNIRNMIAVPLCGKDKIRAGAAGERTRQAGQDGTVTCRGPNVGNLIGMMVAINRIDKQDFDSTDVKLFNSVASECAVFVENNRLFSELKELFIGSLKALTRSIDAKDRYTRGHSERVAFISKWLAERLGQQEGLDEEQVHKIYLAGLLHDIGKVGIDEAVLCKKGELTEQEQSRLRMHPSIGANILSGIKQMREIIPGVLCHHERMDGTGYPDELTGDEIPLVGKIVGLADCFDAMTSERVYRRVLTVEEAVAEIGRRLGTQFDEKVGRVFVDSDVYHLWDIMQEGLSKTYGAEDFSDYGATAVGALIR